MNRETEPIVGATSPTAISRNVVLRIALIGEGLLIALGLLWIALREIPVAWGCSWAIVGTALLLTAPLIAVNVFLFLGRDGPRLHHPAWRLFANRYVRPLCAELTPLPALLVALLAGLGEEIVFRGVLLTELRPLLGDWGAVVVSGVVFGWVHFLGLWRDFWPVFVLYCLFGIALGAIYLAAMNLTLLVLIHSLYDFVVICLVHRAVRRSA